MSFDLTPGVNSFTDATFTSDQTTRIVTSAFSQIIVTSAASSVDVTCWTNNNFGDDQNSIGLYIDDVYVSRTLYASAGGSITHTIALPGSGTRTMRFVSGGTSQASGAGIATMVGCWPTLLAFNAAFTQLFPTNTSNVCIYGDSIANTQKATPSHQNGFAPLVRQSFPGRVWLEGGGSGNVTYDTATQARIDAWTARIVAALPNTAASTLWCQMGTNDVLDVAATFKTNYSTLVDAAHTALPNINIVMASLLPRSDGAGANEPLAVTLRTKQAEIVAARTGFMVYVHTPYFINYTDDLAIDGLHLTTQGHSKYATYMINHLNGIRRYRLTTS